MRKNLTLIIAMMLVAAALSSIAMNISPTVGATVLSGNVKVNDEIYTGQKIGTKMVVLDSGKILTVWGEQRGGNRDIYLSYSSNNGTTFSPDMIVNNNRTGAQNTPAIAAGTDTDVYVAWQDDKQGSSIFVGKSTNGGKAFGSPVMVSDMSNSYQIRADIAANQDNVAVIWEDTGSDNSIYIWDPATEALVKQLEGHTGAVRGLEYSPNGAKLVSGAEDNLIKVWDTSAWTETTKTDHRDQVTDIGWYSDGSKFISSSWDGTVKIWDSSTLGLVKNLNQSSGIELLNPVNAIDISEDMSHIAAVCNGREITSGYPTGLPNKYFNLTVWDTSDWTSFTVNEISGGGHDSSVNDVVFSHNGSLIATGSKGTGDTIKVWNSTSGVQKNAFSGLGAIKTLAWSPDDTYIAAGLSNDTIIVFEYSNFSNQSWLKGHKGDVNDISWDAQNTLISGGSDPYARVWNPDTETETENLGMHRNTVYALDRIASGTRIATGGGNSGEKGRSESQIYCAISTDGGMNFGEPVVVSETLSGMKHSPKVAMDGNDVTSIVWYDDRSGRDGVYFSNSTDMGVSFSDDIPVSVTAEKVENLPTITAERDTGTVHLAWQKQTGGDTSNPIHDIHYANSSDGFNRVLVIDPNTAVQQTPDIAATPDGSQVYVTWIDSRLGGTPSDTRYQVFLYNSSDGGMTFSGYDVVNDEDTQSKYSQTVGVNKYGDLAVVWHDYRDVGVNIYYSGNVLADTTDPIIISVTPEAGAANVSIFKPIIIEFSEPMDRTSVEDAFSLTTGTQTFTAVDFIISWSGYGDEIRLTPSTPMLYNSAYTAELDTGPLDISGNAMATGLTWDFSTGSDWDPPVIQEQLTIEVSGLTFTIIKNETFDVNYDEAATIHAEIKDYNGEIDETRIYYKGVGDTSYSNILVMDKTGGLTSDDYSATIPAQNSLGNMSFYIWASDIKGNVGNTTPYTYFVIDSKAPEIGHQEITEWPVHSPISIEARVTDFSNLASIRLAYKNEMELSFTVVNMSYIPTSGNYSAEIPEQLSIGVLEYNITAVDVPGNENRTDNVMVDVIDVTKPVIELYEPLNLEDKSISIVAEVTDDIAIEEVSLYFKAVGGKLWVKRTMSLVSGNEYAYTIPAQTKSGKIYYYVNATDTSGNTGSTLDDIQDFAHEWPVKGTETPWLAYIIPIVILIGAIMLAWAMKNRRKGKPGTEEPDEKMPAEPEQQEESEKGEVEPQDEMDMEKTGEEMNKKDEPESPEQKVDKPEIESVDANEGR